MVNHEEEAPAPSSATLDQESSSEESRHQHGEGGDSPALEKLAAERDQAVREKNEIVERFQRAQAEFENIRKRMQREQDEVREYAAMSLIESLLPVVDDFDRALAAPGGDGDLKKGLELIRNRMAETLQRAGLKPVDDCGRFDPNVHQAVDSTPAESGEQDQAILEVYRKGYFFKDRLLRPAMVRVAVKE